MLGGAAAERAYILSLVAYTAAYCRALLGTQGEPVTPARAPGYEGDPPLAY